MTAAERTTDSRQARSDATKNALMRAAEKLIAERGIGNVSISDIVAAAEQKNQSALQYHFSNLGGLIDAVLAVRRKPISDAPSSSTYCWPAAANRACGKFAC